MYKIFPVLFGIANSAENLLPEVTIGVASADAPNNKLIELVLLGYKVFVLKYLKLLRVVLKSKLSLSILLLIMLTRAP